MYRTSEEEREYQNLDYKSKKRYDNEVEMDPSLTHKQVMQILGLQIVAKETVIQGGSDINMKSPQTRKTLLDKLNNWLRENAKSVWYEVKDQISRAINYLGDLISRGIDWFDEKVVSPIADWLDDIFG